jgi:hypothetical protein
MRLLTGLIALACAAGLTAAAVAQTPTPGGPRPGGPGGGIPQIGGDPAPAALLFREEWNNLPLAQPMTPAHLSNKALALHLYGDIAGIRKSAHPTENYTYTGETLGNWAITLSDPASLWDLSAKGKVMLKTRNSGYRLTHILIKTADGKWYASEEGSPESSLWIEREYILADLHWRNLMMEDKPTNPSNQRQPIPTRTPIVPTSVGTPNLSRIEEIGFSDLMVGGWIPASTRVNAWAVYGKKVAR